jgi:hypothetical protein
MSRHLQFSYPLTLDREVLLLHLKGLLKDFVPVEISIASAASKTSIYLQLSKPLDLRCFTKKKFIYMSSRPIFRRHIRGRTLFNKKFEENVVLNWNPWTEELSRLQQMEKLLMDQNLELADLRSFKEKVLKMTPRETKQLNNSESVKQQIRSIPLSKTGIVEIREILNLCSEIIFESRKLI